jgi:hypothetical protein
VPEASSGGKRRHYETIVLAPNRGMLSQCCGQVSGPRRRLQIEGWGISAPNKTAAQVGEKARMVASHGMIRRSA